MRRSSVGSGLDFCGGFYTTRLTACLRSICIPLFMCFTVEFMGLPEKKEKCTFLLTLSVRLLASRVELCGGCSSKEYHFQLLFSIPETAETITECLILLGRSNMLVVSTLLLVDFLAFEYNSFSLILFYEFKNEPSYRAGRLCK